MTQDETNQSRVSDRFSFTAGLKTQRISFSTRSVRVVAAVLVVKGNVLYFGNSIETPQGLDDADIDDIN